MRFFAVLIILVGAAVYSFKCWRDRIEEAENDMATGTTNNTPASPSSSTAAIPRIDTAALPGIFPSRTADVTRIHSSTTAATPTPRGGAPQGQGTRTQSLSSDQLSQLTQSGVSMQATRKTTS
jgi:hypothetical protein